MGKKNRRSNKKLGVGGKGNDPHSASHDADIRLNDDHDDWALEKDKKFEKESASILKKQNKPLAPKGVLDFDSESSFSDEEDAELSTKLKDFMRTQKITEKVSDFEDSDEDDIEEEEDPDVNADWGYKKSSYHSGHIDEGKFDLKGDDKNEPSAAVMEEEGALKIQKHFAKMVDDQDFTFVFQSETPADEGDEIEKPKSLKAETDELSILLTSHPELKDMKTIHDTIVEELEHRLFPVMKLIEDERINVDDDILQFLKLKINVMCGYVSNIIMYTILAKTSNQDTRTHPIVKRLLQFRNMHNQIEDLSSMMNDELDIILESSKEGSLNELRFVSKSENTDEVKSIGKHDKSTGEVSVSSVADEGNVGGYGERPLAEDENDDDEDEKRGATYEMVKNKGMVVKRKKEARNPRVMNRKRFKKAQIRNKSQRKIFKPAMGPYGGEHAGINAGLKRSVNLKA